MIRDLGLTVVGGIGSKLRSDSLAKVICAKLGGAEEEEEVGYDTIFPYCACLYPEPGTRATQATQHTGNPPKMSQ